MENEKIFKNFQGYITGWSVGGQLLVNYVNTCEILLKDLEPFRSCKNCTLRIVKNILMLKTMTTKDSGFSYSLFGNI